MIDRAYAWLRARRRDYSANDAVWTVRWRWPRLKPQLQAELRAGTYRFSAVRRIQTVEGAVEAWIALDALVLKRLAIVLARRPAPHLCPRCYHLAEQRREQVRRPKGGRWPTTWRRIPYARHLGPRAR